MARPVPDDFFEKPIEKTYSTWRSELKSGDLLFCSGDYAVSRLIEKFTKSPWSHVGIILKATAIDRVLLLESVEDFGVRLAPISKYLSDYQNGQAYSGALVLARYCTLTDAHVTAIAQFGIDQLTKPYNNDEIAEIVARIALLERKDKTSRGYICSELVAACFKAAGIDIQALDDRFVTPNDVWRDDNVTLLGRIH